MTIIQHHPVSSRCCSMRSAAVADIGQNRRQAIVAINILLALRRTELRRTNSLIRNHAVILKTPAQMALIGKVKALWRHGRIFHLLEKIVARFADAESRPALTPDRALFVAKQRRVTVIAAIDNV